MKEEYKEFAVKFAQTIVDADFEAAHKFFAPWLREEVSVSDFRKIIENYLREMNEVWEIKELFFPDEFEISYNSSSLESLREDHGWREPRKISDEVTTENFRKWIVIQFLPREDDERFEFDGWFDFWFILVETNGEFGIGYFELADVD